MTLAAVKLWGRKIGAVHWDRKVALGFFEYEPGFRQSGIQPAPLTMPLSERIHSFSMLGRETFLGLPGMLADSLPDRFGNALIDAWLAEQGKSPGDFDSVERLCYIGSRGMGALEFEPARDSSLKESGSIEIAALVQLANVILSHRDALHTRLGDRENAKAFRDMLKVGTSAGGARAKAVIAWNVHTGEIRSGQVPAGQGFSYWLLKFDGVGGNRDKELEDPMGFGRIEYAYHRMALDAGIEMSECRLLEENGRSHFAVKRFDRDNEGHKLHMQSLGAMAHLDFNQPGANSYEQAFEVIRQLGLGMDALEEQFRRMTFNIVARNQDDHVKNIAFLMDRTGTWRLSPAYDINYSYTPRCMWTSKHQMSLNGKRDGFSQEDFIACEKTISMKRGRAIAILGEICEAVRRWPDHAEQSGVRVKDIDAIGRTHRADLLPFHPAG